MPETNITFKTSPPARYTISSARRDQRRYDYSAVARWTRPKKLQICNQSSCSVLDCDRLIAPVHLGVHWTCAMADLSNKEFIYYDSMGVSLPRTKLATWG